ncbi:MAG: ABC transporter permease [Gammaproteobacteria bacterium]
MTFIAVLRLATRGVRRYRLRSCLTSLGITIGTASFIAMIGIGHGARLKVEDSLKSLDSSLLIAVATERRADGMPTAGALPESRGLSQEDYFAIRSDLRGIRASSLQVTTSINQAGARGRYIGAQVLGVGEAGLRLLGRKLEGW